MQYTRLFAIVFGLYTILLSAPILADAQVDHFRIRKAQLDIQALGYALDLYKLHNYKYPTTQQGLAALVAKPTIAPIPSRWQGPYIAQDNKAVLPKDPWGLDYQYQNQGEKITIYSFGADGKPGGTGIAADIYLPKK